MTVMLAYDFMRTAFAAGALVAVVASVVGYFLVLRQLTFAGHALSHVGFAGAGGALLLGASPLWGLLAFTLLGGALMGLLGERLRGRDVAVGIILAVSLGLGTLALHFVTSFATQTNTLLFGNVFGVGGGTLGTLAWLGALCLLALGAIARPLLFASLDPDLAEARGVPLRLLSVLFLLVVAVAVVEAVQVVGVLLVFALMVGPPAAAARLTPRFGPGVLLGAVIALLVTLLGITLAYASDWPSSFWISALSGGVYGLSLLRRPDQPAPAPPPR